MRERTWRNWLRVAIDIFAWSFVAAICAASSIPLIAPLVIVLSRQFNLQLSAEVISLSFFLAALVLITVVRVRYGEP